MNRLYNHLFFIMMSFYSVAHAQEEKVPVIQWKIAGRLPPSEGQRTPLGFAGPVAGISNDVLIFAGGANFPNGMPWQGGKKRYYDDVYVYKCKSDKLVRQRVTGKLAAPVAYAAVCSTPAGVLYAGGENDQGISNKVVLLQWNPSFKKIIAENLPNLPVALTNAAATVCANTVYIGGGETNGGVSDRFFCLHLDSAGAGWTELASVPLPVSHTVMVAQPNGKSGCIYVLGGRRKNENAISNLYASVYAFDIAKNEWSEKKSLPYPLTAGTGIALGSSNIYLFGGDKGKDFHQSELMAASIKTAGSEAERQQLMRKKNQLQAAHPGFSKELLQYNTLSGNCAVVGEIPYPVQVTTHAIQWHDCIFIPGGEIRAGVRTPLIVAAEINKETK